MKALTILSHNTFWFQGVPFLSDIPPEPDVGILRQLCDIYREVSPDIICLQEIQSQKTFELVSEYLEMPGCYNSGVMFPQYGGAVFWRPHVGRQIYNSHCSSLKTQRIWQIVELKTDNRHLRICNIHLPSNRHLGSEQAAVQRISELQDVIWNSGERPDIILGDFNEIPGNSTGTFLKTQDYIDTAILSNNGNIHTNISDKRGDYIWIDKQMTNCTLKYDVTTKQNLAFNAIDKQYLSDHLPLWITIEC